MTGHLLYTEEDVTLAERVVIKARNDGCGWRWAVRAILDDLAARNRLVPPGSEVQLKPCSFLEHGGCYDGPCQVELTRPGCHVAGLSGEAS